ncbi:MAG: hypothetical protein LQ342_006574 [Letrouitia transgressa]|nr:MAG: hypothetical protein LQ342_006574 [Letrouitia transgressa]
MKHLSKSALVIWVLVAIVFADDLLYERDLSNSNRTHLSEDDIAKSPLLSLHRELVQINSTSGGEGDVDDFLTSYLEAHNFTVSKQYLPAPASNDSNKTSKNSKRFNILAYPGSTNHTRFLLTSHVDTVPPFYNYTFYPNNSTIFGRGTVDDKACVATQFFALQSLLESREISPDDAALLFVVNEEAGGEGMKAFSKLDFQWDAVVFGEPTEGKLATGHKGALAFNLTAHGKTGHSGYPWIGKSAIDSLISALSALRALEPKLPRSEKYGNSTLNIGKIDGGIAGNVIADKATALLNVRIGGSTVEGILSQIRETVKAVDDEIEVGFIGGVGPIPIDGDIEGFGTAIENYGTDITNLKGKHKRYLYGPGTILVAHSDHEYLFVHDLYDAVEGYKRILRALIKR